MFTRRLGPRSLEVGLNLASLAAVEQRRGRRARARGLYARALAIQERLLGRDHADVAMTVNNLAVLERDAGRLDRCGRRCSGAPTAAFDGRWATATRTRVSPPQIDAPSSAERLKNRTGSRR